MHPAGLPAGRTLQLNIQDVQAIRDKVPEVQVVAPRNQLGGFMGGNNVSRGRKAGAFSVMGDYPEIRQIQSFKLEAGRFLNQFDMDDSRKVAVIGTRVRDVLFARGEQPVGQWIVIHGVYFQVVGVFRSVQSGDDADRDAQTIFVPFPTFQRAFNFGDRVGWMAVISRPDVPASAAEEKVLVVQGTGFNWPKTDHFRVVFLPDADLLTDAIGRIARFLDRYHRRHAV